MQIFQFLPTSGFSAIDQKLNLRQDKTKSDRHPRDPQAVNHIYIYIQYCPGIRK